MSLTEQLQTTADRCRDKAHRYQLEERDLTAQADTARQLHDAWESAATELDAILEEYERQTNERADPAAGE